MEAQSMTTPRRRSRAKPPEPVTFGDEWEWPLEIQYVRTNMQEIASCYPMSDAAIERALRQLQQSVGSWGIQAWQGFYFGLEWWAEAFREAEDEEEEENE